MTTYSAIAELNGDELFHGVTSLEEAQNIVKGMFGNHNHAWIVPTFNDGWRQYAFHVETCEGRQTFHILATVVTH